jgi:FixJ family two-component response regulator
MNALFFGSIAEFTAADRPNGPACLVLDVRLPGRSGLDFQRDLKAADVKLPVIFMTGYGDVAMSVQAMKGGAIEFLVKPFREQDLLEAINLGLARDGVRHEHSKVLGELAERFARLSPRERAIMIQVTHGRLNKQIADTLGITETTVKVHRHNLMRKMQAGSLPGLCQMAQKLKLLDERSTFI